MQAGNEEQARRKLTPAPNPMISSEALEPLRAVLRAGVPRANDPDTRVVLQRAMHTVCEAARRHECTAERLLVEFKDLLRSLPEARRVMAGSERDDLVARMVTLLIEAYFATPLASDGADVAPSPLGTSTFSASQHVGRDGR